MEAPRFVHLFFIMFGALFLSSGSGMRPPFLSLHPTVFVAFEGEDLSIDCNITKQQNRTKDYMKCFDPLGGVKYSCEVPATQTRIAQKFPLKLQLENVTISGEYHCQYETASVYWFVRVRADGYKEPTFNYNDFIIVAVVTGVLLVFSVAGSISLFRGHWKEQITMSGKASWNQRQNRGGTEENNVDKTAPSTSFYASLNTRPRSIYDVLDHSAVNWEQDQRETKPDNNELTKNMEQSTKCQDEDPSESVYENF